MNASVNPKTRKRPLAIGIITNREFGVVPGRSTWQKEDENSDLKAFSVTAWMPRMKATGPDLFSVVNSALRRSPSAP